MFEITSYLSKQNMKCVYDDFINYVALDLTFPLLTLKASITTAADDICKYFFIAFQRK